MERYSVRLPTFDEFQKTNASRKESDKYFKNTGAKVFIDDLGKETIRPRIEQIEEAREEMENEIDKEEKMEIVSRTTMESHLENTNTLIQKIQYLLGSNVKTLDLWKPVSKKLGQEAQEEAIEIIESIKIGTEQESFLYKISKTINRELNLNIKNGSSQNVLVSEIVKNGAKLKNEGLIDMESALFLYGLIGKYKFFAKQNTNPLVTAIYASEEMLQINKDFNLENTGFFQICSEIKKAYACLSLDLHTKPHYISISPIYQEKANQYYEILKRLSKIEAKDFLKHEDITLDKGFSNKKIH